MMWFFAILVMLVLGAIAFVAAGRWAPLAPAYDDRPDALVPEGRPLAADDLRKVRFSLALRGYRMSEVDALLDRLAREREDVADAAFAPDEAAENAPAEKVVTEDVTAEPAGEDR